MVHAARKTGEFAEKARSVIGPDYNGLIVRVRLHEGRYAGAAKLPSNGARPYWRTFANAYTIARGKQHLHLYIEYGLRTDPKLVARVRKVLTSVVDNAPATNEINDAKKQVGDVDKRSTIWAALSIDQPIFVGKQTERLMVHFALVNDGQRPIDPAVGSWRLNINGKDHPDSQLMFGNGPRDDRWESLPAGEHLSFAYATGDWFEEPGIYCRGHGFQSAPVVLRVQP